MKVLYAIQSTGNGHIARAREIIPLLKKQHDVDILVSGTQADIDLPFVVKYKCNGLGFIFGKKGGVDIFDTYKKVRLRKLFNEINSLPVLEYDVVLNDFEPVSAWACKLKFKECIAVSHQCAVLNKSAPQSKNSDPVGKAVLKKYAPATEKYGFHFQAYDKNIFTPVIRKEIRKLAVSNNGHYTVYLPAYEDKRILDVLHEFPETRWEVFSKHTKKISEEKNTVVRPITNDTFIKSLAACTGVLCGAGFEAPAEALFLGKKLLVIPMKAQFEQQCNAAALKQMGVPVIKSLKKKHLKKIKDWLQSPVKVTVDYPDNTAEILNTILEAHEPSKDKTILTPGKKFYTLRKFRDKNLKRILRQLETS